MPLPPPPKSRIEKRALSDDEKILKLKLEQSAKIIAEVIKDKSILTELNGQISKKLKITKNEESLTFKELFAEPNAQKVESSGSLHQKSFTMDANVAQHFKDRYLEVAKNKTYDHPEKYAALEQKSSIKTNVPSELQPTSDITTIDGAEVYFPYSENFLNPELKVDPNLNYTVTSNPIDNDAENEGVVWNDITQTWDYVLVNDNYAWDKPTFIVNIDEPSTNNYYTSATDPIPTPNLTGRQVLIGQVMSTEQYGELFTGGPDIRFCVFLPGSLTAPFSINNDFKEFRDGMNTAQAKFTRKQVRRHTWINVYTIIHSNWVPTHDAIDIGLYEDDSNNWFAQSKITFEPKVTYDKTTVSLGSVVFTGKGNDYIGEYQQDRISFFALNQTDQYLGTRTDEKGTWRIYRQGAVYYTMPVINF